MRAKMAVLGVAAAVTLSACGGGSPAAPTAAEPVPHLGEATGPDGDRLEVQVMPPTPVASEAGARLVEERCAACHDLGRVYAETRDRQQWAEEVDEMIERGALLTAEERDLVIDYLATR